ncbi:hypothetical protein F4778DRAFT_792835 [Xylariomycetidae sp. FL2044]|nr:hypothetical protein F4778DRAFT_792835 [Xylariomycetidae sp. FL2044]
MPRRTNKRKAAFDLSDESDDLFVKKTRGQTKKAVSKKKRLSRLEEYDEDEGRASSRGFQKWAEMFENHTKGQVNKSKAALKDFRNRIQEDAKQLRLDLKEHGKQMDEKVDKRDSLVEKIYQQVASAQPDENGSNGKTAVPMSKETHILFKAAQSSLSENYNLVKNFKDAEQQLKDGKLDLPLKKWKQGKAEMEDLIARGQEHGERLIESLLAPNTNSPPSSSSGKQKMGESDKLMAVDLFKHSSKALHGDNWGTVAADRVKWFTSLAKAMAEPDPRELRQGLY